jgi:hypothetical protein
MGRGRKTRRALASGGRGIAERLNDQLGAWSGAKITPMFGRWGYLVGETLFGAFPLRDKERDLWIRLSMTDQARALAVPGVRPHRRFASRGWIEYDVNGPEQLSEATRWLRRGYEAARRAGGDPVTPG